MKEEKTKFDRDELELVRLQVYDGYAVDQLCWTFLTYAVVTPIENGKKLDVIDNRIYTSIDEDEEQGFFYRENLEKNDMRVFSTSENEIFRQLLDEKDNDIESIKYCIVQSGFYFHYHTDLAEVPTFVKSLKR